MQLYYAPLACSTAARIALYEAGAAAEFIYVDIHTRGPQRVLSDGNDYHLVNPMGQVPALRTAEGEILTENPAVLQYVADQYPAARLGPTSGIQRYRLQQWLSFIASELHTAVYIPLLTPSAPEGAKAFARQKLPLRFTRLSEHLQGREFLLDAFTIADAYLIVVLNWSPYAALDLDEWPVVKAYFQALSKRPSIERALREGAADYAEEQAAKRRRQSGS
jgi:glutathione S-transferase